ncbi:hypothetical protein FUAX_21340 [Fulvitalea axinellae]|uniref:Threonine/serine exporter-like N-terminal domain-containing protein n=1 Tax=Fulvitalea axinellae TaxID=1182444 RepID=A0AAU9CP25_9BACT|nr:hypothetical protein FUAX_21340 [Fulvitalea axinellae]
MRQGKCFTEDENEVASLLFRVAKTLMASGAHTARIVNTLTRFANGFGFDVDIFITYGGITFTLFHKDDPKISCVKSHSISIHGVNLSLVAAIGHLSWDVLEKETTLKQVVARLDELEKKPRYSRLTTLAMVSLADGAFCKLFGGDYYGMFLAFVATFIGLFVRQKTLKANLFISVTLASFTASTIASVGVIYNLGETSHIALATTVLFLIPGVPLISAGLDILEGHVSTGIARAFTASGIIASIAAGIMCAMFLLGLGAWKNFMV